jgi:tetratricopeptide (TPR) repeat protein
MRYLYPAIFVSLFFLTDLGILFAQEYPLENSDNLDQVRTSAASKFRDGKWEEARKTTLEALQLAQGKWGPIHPALVPFLDDLGAVDRQLGLYADALKQYQWALALQEKALAPDDPALVVSLDNLACLYDDLGRYSEAEVQEQRILQIDDSTGAPENLIKAQRLDHWGRIELHLGKLKESEDARTQALAIAQKKLGISDSKLVPYLEGLALACAKNGHFSTGEELLQKALKIQVRNTVGTSVESADSLKYLGDYYWVSGDKGKAKTFYDQALQNYLRLVPFGTDFGGLNHEEKAAQCQYRLGNYQQAGDLFQKVIETLPNITGNTNPKFALVLAELSAVQKALGQKEEADKNRQQALSILQNALSKNHPLCLSLEKNYE